MLAKTIGVLFLALGLWFSQRAVYAQSPRTESEHIGQSPNGSNVRDADTLAFRQERPRRVRPVVELGGTLWGIPNYIPRISNVPLALRQVPGHKDDFPSGGVVITVPDASINPQRFVNVGVAAAPGIAIGDRLSLRLGAHWFLPLAQYAQKANGGATREINLQGTTDRGIGRSLVYYSAQYSPAHHPGVFGEVEGRVSKKFSLLAGYQLDFYDLTIERGWDRFDALETYNRTRIASSQLHMPYAGVRVFNNAALGLVIFGGPTFTRLKLEPLAGSAQVQMSNPGIVIGVRVGKTFGFGRSKGT